MDFDHIEILIAIGYFIYRIYAGFKKRQQEQQERSKGAVPPVDAQQPSAPTDAPPAPDVYTKPDQTIVPEQPTTTEKSSESARLSGFDIERLELVEKFTALNRTAYMLANSARHERATRLFADTIDVSVVPLAYDALTELSDPVAVVDDAHYRLYEHVSQVLAQIDTFVTQRRDPRLRAQLGDADTLALSCYQPLMNFAAAEELQLTSGRPVTQLGGYNLAIWTGFLETGLAPIFLPPQFFDNIFWWPAIAHEIGHDFLAATKGVQRGIRRQLGLPSENKGTKALPLGRVQLTEMHLWRLLGGWFEELFCDAVGTLMLGPAFGLTMVKHFAAPEDSNVILLVERSDEQPLDRYGIHPPRHLRVVACAYLLGRMGHTEEAKQVLDDWEQIHGEIEPYLLFPHGAAHVALPLEPFVSVVTEFVDRLHDEQFSVLAGYRLSQIPGVDYGVHLHAQAGEVATRLSAGQLPRTTSTRAVIAGAVLAAYAAPARATQILALARRVVVAEGTFEHIPDAYDLPGDVSDIVTAPPSPRDAFILHTLIAPPVSLRSFNARNRQRPRVDRLSF